MFDLRLITDGTRLLLFYLNIYLKVLPSRKKKKKKNTCPRDGSTHNGSGLVLKVTEKWLKNI